MQHKREDYIDILKAIGIISIVVGHGSWILPETGFRIGPFVYTYHIMLFLFVAGICFKKENSIQPWTYIGKRLKGLVPLYVGYSILFVLMHNFLLSIHIIGGEIYGFTQILNHIASAFTLVSSENMLGAFWFLPMYCFTISFLFYYFILLRQKDIL